VRIVSERGSEAAVDGAAKPFHGLDYATKLLATICAGLGEIDLTPGEPKKLPIEGQRMILEERRRIVRALCDKVQVFTDGQVKIDGVLDGSEGLQFDLSRP